MIGTSFEHAVALAEDPDMKNGQNRETVKQVTAGNSLNRLSKLQRAILRLAWGNLQFKAAWQRPDRVNHELYVHEILALEFNLQEYLTFDLVDARLNGWHSGQKFSGVDRKLYNCAQASVSRSLYRLRERGLITISKGFSWTGLSLTPLGLVQAAKL